MKTTRTKDGWLSGVSLMEVIVSVGVLAMAVPLVLAAMASGGESDMAAKAENRSCVMVAACMDELSAASLGKSALLPGLADGKAFPVVGKVCALAFSESGRMLGALDRAGYDGGVKMMRGERVGFIASMRGVMPAGAARLMDVRVAFEYPAAAAAGKRKGIVYQTRLP